MLRVAKLIRGTLIFVLLHSFVPVYILHRQQYWLVDLFVVPKRRALVLYNLYSDQIVGKSHFHQLIFSTYLRPSFEYGLEDWSNWSDHLSPCGNVRRTNIVFNLLPSLIIFCPPESFQSDAMLHYPCLFSWGSLFFEVPAGPWLWSILLHDSIP